MKNSKRNNKQTSQANVMETILELIRSNNLDAMDVMEEISIENDIAFEFGR